jgi:hypothetical protein
MAAARSRVDNGERGINLSRNSSDIPTGKSAPQAHIGNNGTIVAVAGFEQRYSFLAGPDDCRLEAAFGKNVLYNCLNFEVVFDDHD